MFLVETSTKVSLKDLEDVRKLIQSFSKHHIEQNTVRMSVMTFSKDIRIDRQLQILNNDDVDDSNKFLKPLTQLPGEPALADALENATNHLIQQASSSNHVMSQNNRKVIVSIVKTLSTNEISKARNVVFKMRQRVKDLQMMSIVLDGVVGSADLLKLVSPLASVPKATNTLIAPDFDKLSNSVPSELASKMMKGMSCFNFI